MASAEQLRNYLMTPKIGPGSCVGFEDEALGACIGLVNWGSVGMSSRTAWLRAVTMASFNKSGGLTAGASNKSFFYSALQHRQRSAFSAYGVANPKWDEFDVADFPWALPEPLFRTLLPDVRADKGRTYENPPTWDDVLNVTKALGAGTPAWIFGKKMFAAFLTKYAPDLVGGAMADWAGPASAAALYGAVGFENIAAKCHNVQTKQAFEIDAKRRDYDRLIAATLVSR